MTRIRALRLAAMLFAAAILGACTIAAIVHPQNYSTAAEVHQRFAGKTLLYRGGGHGNQIEYYRADGVAFLWYPGNSVILQGLWRVEEYTGPKIGSNELCFLYGPNTYNPITKKSGDQWECSEVGVMLVDVKDEAEGDLLGLANLRRVPFVLPKYVESLAAVQAQMQ